jgi:BolA protein
MPAAVKASVPGSIEQRLAALVPERMELLDESGRHVGHAGARDGGGHYRLTIVSPRFSGQTTLARHRMVYDALGPMMQHEIHALAITAIAPDEPNSTAKELS